MNTAPIELTAMRDLPDYRVCSEDTDPRGWNVIDADGFQLGAVTDLIIDVQALTVRYIVCSLAAAMRQVLIPTGFARLDEESRQVHLDFVTAADTEQMPHFVGLPLTEQYSAALEKALTGVAPSTSNQAKIVRRSP
jgi:hypothetical protein